MEANQLKKPKKRLLKKETKRKNRVKKRKDNYERYTIKSVLMELPFAFMMFIGIITLFAILWLFTSFFLQFLF